MPIVQYVKGDLLSHNGPIAHGVNCQGKMASGVAKAIRDCYPEVYSDYMEFLLEQPSKSIPPLGSNTASYVEDGEKHRLIVHMFTQEFYGRDGKKYVDYDAIRSCFAECDYFITKIASITSNVLGIPKIGAGLGGGDWEIISKIIDEVTPNLEIWVYEI